MNQSNRKVFLAILILTCLFNIRASAIKLSGIVRDEKDQPLPFVIVYVTGTSIGTTANIDGIYSLDLQKGNYDISFRLIGYSLLTKKVVIDDQPVKLDVKLLTESIKLKEVNINASAEDPAYEIIRKAQAKRKFYLDQVKLYRTNAYVKSTQRLTSHPNKVLGQKVDIGSEIDSVTGIFYLSESVSDLYFKAPSTYKEHMISSKVSGSPQTYSFNQSTDVLINFYESLIDLESLTPRGIVSPIAGNSIFYYKFRLEGTFMENGQLINKISVIPKRKYDPVFTGTIYIADETWRLYNVDLLITREQQMEFVDTFHVVQNFIRVNDDVWMPFTCKMDYSFNFLGFQGSGIVLGIFSDYKLNPSVNRNFFNGEVLLVDENSNKKDTAYWKDTRPVQLTTDEIDDYQRRDSIRVVHESKTYLDSMDRKSNKLGLSSFLTVYNWQNSYRHEEITATMPLSKIAFNTVEGWNTGIAVAYTKRRSDDDPREYTITPEIRYGFSNEHLNAKISYENFYNAKKNRRLKIEGGTDVSQINSKNPISEFVNTLYSLMAEKNYMKIYEKQFGLVSHTSEIVNGLAYRITGEYAHRISLPNSTDYSFTDVENRDYTSNDPYVPTTDSFRFESHNAFIAELGLSFKPGQEYITRPEGKYNLGSDWPIFRAIYRKGIHAAGSDIDYDAFQLSMDDEISLGLFGRFRYLAAYGDFINKKELFIPDMKHFNGNKTWFSDFRIDDFKNLEYYSYSTTGSYFELHGEENFGGFILNKIPLIRKLKFTEVASVHFLHTEELDQYYEISAGVEKLGFLRAELFTSIKNGTKGTIGFLIGIKTNF